MTLTRPALNGAAADLHFRPARRVRRPKLALACIVLIAGSSALFTTLYSRAGHRVPVLAVVHRVAQGQRLSERDLGVVQVSQSGGLQVVPSADEAAVTGATAAAALEPGTLLSPVDLSRRPVLAAGMAIVGLALKAGQFPGQGVVAGARVEVIATPGVPSSGSAATSPLVLTGAAQVVGVQQPAAASGSGGLMVSLEVPRVLAPALAAASAAGQAAVVVVAP